MTTHKSLTVLLLLLTKLKEQFFFCVSVFYVFYLKNQNHHTLFSNHTSIWSRVGVTNQSCESEYRAIASHVVHYQADRMAHW
jgi:hypothetical protein